MPPFPAWRAAVCGGIVWLAATTAAGAEPVPSGAWKGTLGTAAVMVCFSPFGDSQYYYLRHRQGIALAPSVGERNADEAMIAAAWRGGGVHFDERARGANNAGADNTAASSGRWRVAAVSPTEVAGHWTDPSGAKQQVISLRKVEVGNPAAFAGDCGPAFHGPIRAAVHTAAKPARFEGHAYLERTSDDAVAIEVPRQLPHADALNRFADVWLRDQAVASFECLLGRGGVAPEPLGRSLKPIFWSDRWLVLQDQLPETYCGGAHGSSSLSFVTWSWAEGRPVDTWTWLQGGEKSLVAHSGSGAGGRTIASGLRSLIGRRFGSGDADDECGVQVDTAYVEPPYPTAEGLAFAVGFSHAMRACDDIATVEWRLLVPYLSAQGRAVMANATGVGR